MAGGPVLVVNMVELLNDYLLGLTIRQLIKKYKGTYNTTQIKKYIKSSGHARKPGVRLINSQSVNKSVNCKHCNKTFNSSKSMASHTKWCDKGPHRLSTLESAKRSKNSSHLTEALTKLVPVNCEYCGLIYANLAAVNGHKVHCKFNPTKLTPFTRKDGTRSEVVHTSESRKKISDARKKFMNDNPDKIYQHHGPSAPELYLVDKLTKLGINTIPQYHDKRWKRGFKIDIFLPDHNIGIEVNGQFKYTKSGQLKKYYQNRSKIILETSGIKIVDVHYAKVFSLSIDDLIKSF